MEDLAHPERLRAIASMGQAAAGGDESAAAKLLALVTHPVAWYRQLGVLGLGVAAGGSNVNDDSCDKLRSLLKDPSRMVRCAAWKHFLVRADDDAVVAELTKLGESRLGPLYAGKALRQGILDGRKRPGIEDFVMARTSCDETSTLLRLWIGIIPYMSSPSAIIESLPILSKCGSQETWNRLARRHPRLVVDHLRAGLEQPPGSTEVGLGSIRQRR